MPDAHERANSCMTARLHQNALRSIYQDHSQICKGCTNCHIPGVFLMAGGICYDKAAVICRKIAVGHINRDSLFALCHQPVKQQRIINSAAAAPDLAVKCQRLFLIGIEELGIIQNMPDQRRFSIIHTTACDEFQKSLHQK